ncbi:MAG TPA: glycoside hydrolase family 30 beta sandwich domain-containing protein [Candidatus Hydrogenedens sp.]|nr:glycoside hydrolase family 30 beta sandwich domain-containing protein [Candidatus Hydrogenedens sp.]HOL19507.1 glycoside hydrolase family 30 beta sandwich domain-containing protein [Candidatus Hydrogenedens sp.]HPP59389.1 glycoside hydrolase family 30 beta sandwich domain-containing protein [Candidatus Hydrogenedens sp.]
MFHFRCFVPVLCLSVTSLFNTVHLCAEEQGVVRMWISSEDGKYALTEQVVRLEKYKKSKNILIEINSEEKYQSILGMGGSLEHATCSNLMKLSPETREEVIEKLVDPDKGIGMNLMRLCIGTSDFVGEPYYSYNDCPDGEVDIDLTRFSIEKDRNYVIPIVKLVQQKNPQVLFFSSPWSPPGWMKDTKTMNGGVLLREHYPVYAKYLQKYVEAYEGEGIPIYAITVQNEPQMNDKDYPTCVWTAEEQRDFIRDFLGPCFEKSGITTKIWCWDHNWNNLDFPMTIFNDTVASKYVDGTAFHLYEGRVEAQSTLHDAFPDKHIYFTEGSTFLSRGAVKIIEIFRNWARSYNLWVICLDWQRKPNRGPHHASPTMIVLKEDNTIEYRFDYYMYGQFMKFVKRDAVRIFSTQGGRYFNNVAFLNPDGTIVLVVANAESKEQNVSVRCSNMFFNSEIPAKSVVTYILKNNS